MIVLPEGYRELQPHEIFVDQHEAQWHEETGQAPNPGISTLTPSYSLHVSQEGAGDTFT